MKGAELFVTGREHHWEPGRDHLLFSVSHHRQRQQGQTTPRPAIWFLSHAAGSNNPDGSHWNPEGQPHRQDSGQARLQVHISLASPMRQSSTPNSLDATTHPQLRSTQCQGSMGWAHSGSLAWDGNTPTMWACPAEHHI